jgi:hypothetical protein
MSVGYSGTPLVRKLGVRAGMRVVLLQAPPGLLDRLAPLPDAVVVESRLQPQAQLVLLFVTRRIELVSRLDALRNAIAPDGMLWVCWPKKASRVPTDVTGDVIREVVLPTGLVDVKVCAVDEIWSGLKIVVRRELR